MCLYNFFLTSILSCFARILSMHEYNCVCTSSLEFVLNLRNKHEKRGQDSSQPHYYHHTTLLNKQPASNTEKKNIFCQCFISTLALARLNSETPFPYSCAASSSSSTSSWSSHYHQQKEKNIL